MTLRNLVGRMLPESVKAKVRPWTLTRAEKLRRKNDAEMQFWRVWVAEHGSAPETEYYRKFMMDMGDVKDPSFFDGKVCVDIGCGPKGSMTWLTGAKAAIGVDPLGGRYMELGCLDHPMIYLKAGVEELPFADGYVDVLFSMNSLDHVDDFPAACREIRRVVRPGGWFIGSLNLDEPPTITEPLTLTEGLLDRELFSGWRREFHEIRPRLDEDGEFAPYRYFYEPCPEEEMRRPGPRALWCRYRKPLS